MCIITLLLQKQHKIAITNNVSLTTKVIIFPGMWISRFSPLYTCQSTNLSSKWPLESQRRATWNTKVVISPGMWVCRFVDPCTFHATNWACKTPSHSWVPSVTTWTEEVVVPCVTISGFSNLNTSVATYSSCITPAEITRPIWESTSSYKKNISTTTIRFIIITLRKLIRRR
jgi:hypothetical protein